MNSISSLRFRIAATPESNDLKARSFLSIAYKLKAPTGVYCRFSVDRDYFYLLAVSSKRRRKHKGSLGLISQLMSSNEIQYLSAALFDNVDAELALRQ